MGQELGNMLPLAVGSQLYICNFLAAPSLPSQLPNSTFPSPLSRAAFWPAHSFSLFLGLLCFPCSQHKLALPGVGMGVRLESSCFVLLRHGWVWPGSWGRSLLVRRSSPPHSTSVSRAFSHRQMAPPILLHHLSPSILPCSCSSAKPARWGREVQREASSLAAWPWKILGSNSFSPLSSSRRVELGILVLTLSYLTSLSSRDVGKMLEHRMGLGA